MMWDTWYISGYYKCKKLSEYIQYYKKNIVIVKDKYNKYKDF